MEAITETRVSGGDEIRRLHIVYFLSWKGKIEQPHLIRVDHLNSKAVQLRDVKRWLSELRGTEMPDSFTWSYKRKYKAGYIWQDLTDDDLISPISDDDQYVIKGSFLASLSKSSLFFHEGTNPTKKKVEDEEPNEEEPNVSAAAISSKKLRGTLPAKENISLKLPVVGAAAATSTLNSENDERRRAVFKLDSWRVEIKRLEEERRKKNVLKNNDRGVKGNESNESAENRSHRWASDALKNILKCKTVEVKDFVSKAVSNQKSSNSNNERNKMEIKGSLGRDPSAMFKSATEQNCSQCGRPFRTERMNRHINSCKAQKEKGKTVKA